MNVRSGDHFERPVCAAATLANRVDEQINAGAIQEFKEATDALQPFGADIGEGSAYLDDGTVVFTPDTVNCGLCHGIAMLSQAGVITTTRCPVSGSCELRWSNDHPEDYLDNEGELIAERTVCGAELACSAIIDLKKTANGSPRSSLFHGGCKVDELGEGWRERCRLEIKGAICEAPSERLPEFDGEVFGQEAAS